MSKSQFGYSTNQGGLRGGSTSPIKAEQKQ